MTRLLRLLLLCLFLPSAAIAATHTVDTFGGTSGTALEAHTPDSGGPWTNTGGDVGHLALSGTNRLSQFSSTNAAGAWTVPVGTDDQYAAITITSGSSWPQSVIYLAVRVQDQNNYYGFGHNSASGFFIRKIVAGVSTTLKSITNTMVTGDTYKLEAIGNVLTVYKNGTVLDSVTDTSNQFPTGQNVGLATITNTAAASMFTKFEADGASVPPPTKTCTMLLCGVGQ